MLERIKRGLFAFLDYPKRFLSPLVYDAVCLIACLSLVIAGGYYWPSYALVVGGMAVIGGVIAEWYCLSTFKKHVFQYLPNYFWRKDNMSFYDKAENNTLTAVEAVYFLSARWFRKKCDFALGIKHKKINFETVLHFAARHGRADLIEIFLQFGADKRAKNLFNQIPLYTAVENKQMSVLTLLMPSQDTKAELNQRFDWGNQTLLHVACEKRDWAMVQALWSLGADLQIADKYGVTPLEMIVENGKFAQIQFIVELAKIDLSLPLREGVYAIHLFTASNQFESLELLLNKMEPKMINVVNASNLTATDIAHLYQLKEVEALLKKKGGVLTCSEQGFHRLRQNYIEQTKRLVAFVNANQQLNREQQEASVTPKSTEKPTSKPLQV